MHDIVDLRSDTLTLPTPEMREAMAAPRSATTSGRRIRPSSGWKRWPPSVWGRKRALRRLGHDGQSHLRAEPRAGQEVVLDLDSHIFNYEVAGAAVIGVQMRPVKTARGS